jgi:hypothetical protein
MNEMPLLKLLFGSPLFRGVLLTCIVAGLLGWIAMGIRSSGVDACEREHQILLSQALEEEHQKYMALAADAERISTELANTERKLNEKQAEYIAYANAITGNCSGSFGVFLQSASASTPNLPATPGASAGSSAPQSPADFAANIAGANIAINYARFDQCLARYGALLEWHNQAKEALK